MQTDAKALPNPGAAHAVVAAAPWGRRGRGADARVVPHDGDRIQPGPRRRAAATGRREPGPDRPRGQPAAPGRGGQPGPGGLGQRRPGDRVHPRTAGHQAGPVRRPRRARPTPSWPATAPASRSAPSARDWTRASACWPALLHAGAPGAAGGSGDGRHQRRSQRRRADRLHEALRQRAGEGAAGPPRLPGQPPAAALSREAST